MTYTIRNGGELMGINKPKDMIALHKDMTKIRFLNFNPVDLDIFYSVCWKMNDKGTELVSVPFNEIKNLIQYKSKDNARFVKDLDRTVTKFSQMVYKSYEDDGKIVGFPMFSKYEIDPNSDNLNIEINHHFKHLLNDVTHWIGLLRTDVLEVKGTHAKIMLPYLKQWRFHPERMPNIEINKFKDILGIKENYTTSNLNQKIFKPMEKELGKVFEDFKIIKIRENPKAKRGRGAKIKELKFTWKPEIKPQSDKENTPEEEMEQHIKEGNYVRHLKADPENNKNTIEHLEDKIEKREDEFSHNESFWDNVWVKVMRWKNK